MTNLTGRPISGKTRQPSEPEPRVRYSFNVCPCYDERFSGAWVSGTWSRASCRLCDDTGQLKLQLIRLAPGSKAKGWRATVKRTTADDKFSQRVRERDNWTCTVCGRDMSNDRGNLDAMHFIKRGYRALRKGYDKHTGDGCCLRHTMENSLSGCRSCHLRLEDKPENEAHFRLWFGDEQCDQLLSQKPKSKKTLERKV